MTGIVTPQKSVKSVDRNGLMMDEKSSEGENDAIICPSVMLLSSMKSCDVRELQEQPSSDHGASRS